MSRKEEIYEKYMQIFWNGGSEERVEDIALRAMDEYAKEIAIGFARYLILNFLTIPVSYEDSYNQYIQSLTK